MGVGEGLRGTALDPFGYAHVRKVERALRDHYEAMILEFARQLSHDNYEAAVAAAAAADLVRGYEEVKLRNVVRYRRALQELQLPASVPPFPINAEDLPTQPPEARPGLTLPTPQADTISHPSRPPSTAEEIGRAPDEPLYG